MLLEGQSSPIAEHEVGPRSIPLLNRLDECTPQHLLLASRLTKVSKHACFEPQLVVVFAISELLLVEDVLLELIPALLQPLGPELTLKELADLLHLLLLDALGM